MQLVLLLARRALEKIVTIDLRIGVGIQSSR